MNSRVEGWLAIVAALFVMFTALVDPVVSVVIAVAALSVLGVYQVTKSQRF